MPLEHQNDVVSFICFSTKFLQNNDIEGLRKHFFQVLRRSSPYSERMKEYHERWRSVATTGAPPLEHIPTETSPVIYGAGIQLNPEVEVEICEGFSMSRLGTLLDLLVDKFEGVAYPYLYSGTHHSFFPWHIEDGGTYSISYLFAGAPKLW